MRLATPACSSPQRKKFRPASATNYFETATRDTVKKARDIMGSSNGQHKTDGIKNLVFKQSLASFKKHENKTVSLKTAMKASVRLMLVAGYGNEKGEVLWETFKNDLDVIGSQMDRAAGAHLATEAMAKAAPPAPPAPAGVEG